MAVKQYYGSKLSDNMTKLSDGTLLCLNVPIARTGIQKYMADEIGLEGSHVVDVHREPTEVFDAKTLASFNGKAFTDTHPPVDVDVNNWGQYSKGEVTDVRKGMGESFGYIIADILVRDPIVISQIESGAKREISAGYSCEYVERDGKVYQVNMRGNHVALVQSGRAGSTVRICDEEAKPKKSKSYKAIRTFDKALVAVSESKVHVQSPVLAYAIVARAVDAKIRVRSRLDKYVYTTAEGEKVAAYDARSKMLTLFEV